MALLHQASISPTKLEFVTDYLDNAPWGGTGDVDMIGGYRFDDPAGEVGIEGLLVSRDDRVLHIPVTYRGEKLAGADEYLITTMKHSALGDRWIYEAAADPVAVDCYLKALRGEIAQADLELQKTDGTIVAVDLPVRLRLEGTADGNGLVFSDELAAPVSGQSRLIAEWDAKPGLLGGQGVVAALR